MTPPSSRPTENLPSWYPVVVERTNFRILVGGSISGAPPGTHVAIQVRLPGAPDTDFNFYLTDAETARLVEAIHYFAENAVSFYHAHLAKIRAENEARRERLRLYGEMPEDEVDNEGRDP